MCWQPDRLVAVLGRVRGEASQAQARGLVLAGEWDWRGFIDWQRVG